MTERPLNAKDPLDAKNPLDEAIERTRAPFRVLGWCVILLLLSLGVWAYSAELEEVSIAQGEVGPRARSRSSSTSRAASSSRFT
ncbi:MAG: hypothetical protein VCD33_04100 [Alphaproteobacteria bacterium]